jgi:Predicted ribosomal protein
MIDITVFTKKDEYVGIESKGHAGYANEGEDIVCAAVSALMINTVNAIEVFTNDKFTCNQKDGYLELHLTGATGEKSELLMKTLVMGLTGIQENYGDKYIKIEFKED